MPVAAYEACLDSPEFRRHEAAAAEFLSANAAVLAPYRRRWVADPLHQWSRVWEYPFTAHWALRHLEGCSGGLRALDAGSGITYLPFLLAQERPDLSVDCFDQDQYLAPLYASIVHPAAARVKFTAGSLQATGLPDATYDLIYCVSVLEHTRDHGAVLEEFHRLLKPGGALVMTFDISLDGNADIPLPQMREMLAAAAKRFRAADPAALEALLAARGGAGWVDTACVRQRHPEWLPWKYPRLSGALASLRRGRWPRLAAKHLTFACLSFTKP